MKLLIAILLLIVPHLSLAQGPTDPTQNQTPLDWIVGPGEGQIGSQATITLTDDLIFLDDKNTYRFLELNGNIPRTNNYTIASRGGSWFAIFSFDATGYVKDDEEINPDELFEQMKSGEEQSNQYRRENGLEEMYFEAWSVPPHYDLQSKQLEWGVRIRTKSGDLVINYTTRILGREGVMEATLVSSPETIDQDMPVFRASLEGFSYTTGNRYEEFQEGDKVAAYGLAALVAGGAAAAVAKGGGKGLLKMIGFGLLALLAGAGSRIKRFFTGKGNKEA